MANQSGNLAKGAITCWLFGDNRTQHEQENQADYNELSPDPQRGNFLESFPIRLDPYLSLGIWQQSECCHRLILLAKQSLRYGHPSLVTKAIHPSGGLYEIVNDTPIRDVTVQKVKAAFQDLIRVEKSYELPRRDLS